MARLRDHEDRGPLLGAADKDVLDAGFASRIRRPRPLLGALLAIIFFTVLVIFVSASIRPTPDFDLNHGAASELQTSKLGHAPVVDATGERPEQDGGVGINLHPYDHAFRGPRYNLVKWRVTADMRRPDGVNKRVYLINDQFPGPTVEARQGDILIIEVTNALADEGVAIHWHGLHMANYPRMDGAVGFTQDPIPPGHRFTYRFQIPYDQRGTFWYHAHDDLQRADGLFGGLIIHSTNTNNDGANTHGFGDFVREQLLMVGDWYHQPTAAIMDWYMSVESFGNEPVPDSLLINGRGNYDCALAVPARPVDCVATAADAAPTLYIPLPGRYRFRLVNTGLLAGFSVDFGDNNATLVAVDGGNWVNATWGNGIGIVYPGERADVLVDWHADAGSIRVVLDETSFRFPKPDLEATYHLPVRYVEPMERPAQPVAEPRMINMSSVTSHNETERPAPRADHTLVLYANTEKLAHLGNVPTSSINHTSWHPQSPPLLDLERSEYDAHQFIPYIHSPPRDPVWVDVVLNNLDDGPHPFHLHGHHFFVLQTSAERSYWGSWNPHRSAMPPGGPLNVDNPLRKDTVLVPSKGYVVLRFKADNYGKWLFHCHVLWHLAGGMGMGIEVGRTPLAKADAGTGLGGAMGMREESR